jgi:hypothetical protein
MLIVVWRRAAGGSTTAAFGAAAAALKQKLAVVPVHPLPTGDSIGNVSFLVVMSLILGGYLSSTIGMVFGGSATRRGRLASLLLASVLGALLTDIFAGPVLDAIPTSKFLELWGVFVLVMLAVAYATAALQTVLGPAGTLIVVVPSSSSAHRPQAEPSVAYLPTFWRLIRAVSAGRRRCLVRNDLLRRELHHQVDPDPRQLSRRRCDRRDRPPAAPRTRRPGRSQ